MMKASNVLRTAIRRRPTGAFRWTQRCFLDAGCPASSSSSRRLPDVTPRVFSTTASPNSLDGVDIETFVVKMQEYLQQDDLPNSHKAYHELKSALRASQQQQRQQQPGPSQVVSNSPPRVDLLDETTWRTIREDLFCSLITRTKDETLDTASLIEATSQAHEILEDLEERLGLHAMSIPPKEEDITEDLVKNTLDDVQSLETTNVFGYALDVLQAWARASSSLRRDALQGDSSLRHVQRLGRGIPQRSQFLLQQLERLSSDNLPVTYYEAVLKTWACSSEHLRGVQAEKVFQRIPPFALTPAAFDWIIRAWAWSRDPRAAFTATGHLMKRLRFHSNETNEMDFEPALEDYEIIFDAWTRAEDKMAPTKALSMWALWQTSVEEGITSVKPSLAVYRSLLYTATKRPNQPDLGRRVVDELLPRMKEELIIPDTACYESAMCVWKNCALHPEVPEDRQFCLRRTTSLLADLRNAQRRTSADGASGAVTTNALNHVLESLQMSDHSQRTILAEELLKEMEENLSQHNPRASPNADSYRFVLDVYRTLTSRDRIPKAKAILWRCKDNLLLRNEANTSIRKEAVEVLNAFVMVCGTTPRPLAQEEGVLILREALYAVERFRADCSVKPNDATYNNLLLAVKGLLGNGQHGAKIVEKVFVLACQDGVVSDVLLQSLMEVTTPEQYQRLVIAPSETVEDFKVIPESWSRNVLGGRVISADGRRVKPVGIDGHLAETKAMQEFKMRRLRDKRNRNLLQGGRWDRSQDM